jgi:hypothetical protein
MAMWTGFIQAVITLKAVVTRPQLFSPGLNCHHPASTVITRLDRVIQYPLMVL